MQENPSSVVKERQDPLRDRYLRAAEEALIADCAQTLSDTAADPFHGVVMPGDGHAAQWRFGIHRAIGGYHDLPNPGDMLCAAIASCLHASLRMIADRLGVGIEALEVVVNGKVDVRGCLLVDRSVTVGFQDIDCRVRLRTSDCDASKTKMLMTAAEHSCVVLQTLRSGVAVRTHFDVSAPAQR